MPFEVRALYIELELGGPKFGLYQALSREGPGFGTGNNQFNQDPNFGPPNSNSMYNARTSKGIDRTYQAQSREDSGFGTGNNQFNQNPNFGPPNSLPVPKPGPSLLSAWYVLSKPFELRSLYIESELGGPKFMLCLPCF
jgi:hypothetical protein